MEEKTTFKKGDFVEVVKDGFYPNILMGNVYQISDIIPNDKLGDGTYTTYRFKNIAAKWVNVPDYFKKISKKNYEEKIEKLRKENLRTNGINFVYVKGNKIYGKNVPEGYFYSGFENNLYPLRIIDQIRDGEKNSICVCFNSGTGNESFWIDKKTTDEFEIIIPYDYEIPKELLGKYVISNPLGTNNCPITNRNNISVNEINHFFNKLNAQMLIEVEKIEYQKDYLLYTIKGEKIPIINLHNNAVKIEEKQLKEYKKQLKQKNIEKEISIDKEKFDTFLISEHNKVLEEEKILAEAKLKELQKNVEIAQQSLKNSAIEIERIKKHPKIRKLYCSENKLIVETDVLMSDLGQYGKIPLGPYRLILRNQLTMLKMTAHLIEPINKHLNMFNYAHPCIIQSSGDICFGDQKDFIITLGREYRLYDMIMMFINLVESPPGPTPYCDLNTFFSALPLRTKLYQKLNNGRKK